MSPSPPDWSTVFSSTHGSGERDQVFERLFEESPVAASVVDASGVLLRVNKAYARMLGYSREELEGKTFLALSHRDPVEVAASGRLLSLSGRLPEGRCPGEPPSGRLLWATPLSLWATPRGALSGRVSPGDVVVALSL